MSLISGSSESVAAIYAVVVGRHWVIEGSELSPCNIDRICSENTVMCRGWLDC
jgi:hypothetical protein